MGNKLINQNEKEQIRILEQMYLDLLKKQKTYTNYLIRTNNDSQRKLNRKITILQKEVDEYRGFQKGKIWRYLQKYRHLKKYLNNKRKSLHKK